MSEEELFIAAKTEMPPTTIAATEAHSPIIAPLDLPLRKAKQLACDEGWARTPSLLTP